MDYADCDMMKAFRYGLLSHSEALHYILRWQNEIIANLYQQETEAAEARLKTAGVIE